MSGAAASRGRALRCGARLEPSGELVGLPIGGPCEVCGVGVGEHGGHVLELERLTLFCRDCCPACRITLDIRSRFLK